jgi:hypothetical protein
MMATGHRIGTSDSTPSRAPHGFSSRLTPVDAVSLLKKPSAMEVKLLLLTRVTWSEVRPASGGLADEPVGEDLEVLELGEVADLRRQLPVRPLSSTWTAVTRLSESQPIPDFPCLAGAEVDGGS